MSEHTVTVTREDNLWVATASDLPNGVSGVMDFDHFEQVHSGMVEFIADMTETDPAELQITWRYELGGDVTSLVDEYLSVEDEAERITSHRDQVRAELVRELNGPISQRAIADLLGVSHQRVHQLAHS